MKGLGLAVAGLWVLLGVVVVLVATFSEDTPEPTEKAPGPLTCASLQKRAERCADGVSDLAGELVAAYLEGQGESTIGAEIKGTAVASIVYTAIEEKKVDTYCKRFGRSKQPRIRRAWANLAGCFQNPGCEAFIECLQSVARKLDLSSFL